MAQAGHAFLHAFWDAQERYPEQAKEYKNGDHAKKITLVVNTDEEMLNLYEKYRLICGATKVVDAGFTVFDQPTLTCVGIGPISKSLVQDDLSTLATLT